MSHCQYGCSSGQWRASYPLLAQWHTAAEVGGLGEEVARDTARDDIEQGGRLRRNALVVRTVPERVLLQRVFIHKVLLQFATNRVTLVTRTVPERVLLQSMFIKCCNLRPTESPR
jgi:hypothetical protein